MCEDRLCPYLVTLNAARSVVDDLAKIHDSPEAVRGSIAAMHKSAEAVRGCYPCDGPVSGQDSQVRCPLGLVINDAHTIATVPVQRPGWAFPPEKLAGAETDRATGQYL
jgi:hypothetical protein